MEVDGAIEGEDEGRVALESDGDQLLDPPAENAGGGIGRRLLGRLGLELLDCRVAHAALHSRVWFRFCSSTYRAVAYEDASACPSSRASRAKRYHSIHVVSLCPSLIAPRCIGRLFGNLASGLRRRFSSVKNVCR